MGKVTYDPDVPRAQAGHHDVGYETVYWPCQHVHVKKGSKQKVEKREEMGLTSIHNNQKWCAPRPSNDLCVLPATDRRKREHKDFERRRCVEYCGECLR
jgi:hypothetical protein